MPKAALPEVHIHPWRFGQGGCWQCQTSQLEQGCPPTSCCEGGPLALPSQGYENQEATCSSELCRGAHVGVIVSFLFVCVLCLFSGLACALSQNLVQDVPLLRKMLEQRCTSFDHPFHMAWHDTEKQLHSECASACSEVPCRPYWWWTYQAYTLDRTGIWNVLPTPWLRSNKKMGITWCTLWVTLLEPFTYFI